MNNFDVNLLRIGMSREEVVTLFGEPEIKGGTSRKYPIPSVFRYGTIEFHFSSVGLEWVQEVKVGVGFIRKLFPKSD